MLVWHLVMIVALQALSSGRAAILGYTMPVFSALWGAWVFGDRLTARQLAGVAAAGLGVALLLAHEFTRLAGAPQAALAVLVAACVWAYGTHRLRRRAAGVPTLAIAFWMTVVTGVVVALAALLFESARWRWPSPTVQLAIAYNAVGVFAFAQVVWLVLARSLPPIASTLSVMMIPVLGVFSGAVGLGEPLALAGLRGRGADGAGHCRRAGTPPQRAMTPWLDLLLAAGALGRGAGAAPVARGRPRRPALALAGLGACCRPSGAPTGSLPCRWCSPVRRVPAGADDGLAAGHAGAGAGGAC
jgi:hypothetical protein